MEEVPVVESEAIVDVKSGLTRGWSGPLKNAAAQPQAVRAHSACGGLIVIFPGAMRLS